MPLIWRYIEPNLVQFNFNTLSTTDFLKNRNLDKNRHYFSVCRCNFQKLNYIL